MSTAATTRSESALVRPFAGISDADAPLDIVRFLVDVDENEEGTIVLSDDELATAKFSVQLPTRDEVRAAVKKTVVPDVDCGLIVMATARTHRASKVLLHQYLRTADWPTEITFNRSDADLIFNDRAGFTVTVAIVLLNDLLPVPLRPNMAGTWLARREFKVRPEADETSFSPEPLTDEIREHLGLPKGVLRYVDVDGVLDEETLSDAVRVYVDEEVLNLLLANPTDSAAIQLQIELAVQATETVAVVIAKELGHGSVPTVDSLEASPAAKRFYENLARTLDITVANVLELATNQGPALRAFLEDAFDMRAATSTALKEK